MKKIKLNRIKKICWKESENSGERCVVGFVIEESKKEICIASTKNIDGFSDEIKINKDRIVSSTDTNLVKSSFIQA